MADKARLSYPFSTSDGLMSPFTDVADDLVLWLPPGTKIPIYVYPEITASGELQIKFHNNDYSFVAHVVDTACSILDSTGSIVGSIAWNKDAVIRIKANLLANEALPWVDTYVDPFACVYRNRPILSTVRINGNPVDSPLVVLDADESVITKTTTDGSTSLNLYDTDTSTIGMPITEIIINNVVDGPIKVDVDGKHVWLKSEATCDIRVCTDDSITITEISNDEL